MSYVKTEWQSGRAGGTVVSADRLNNLETQYDKAVADTAVLVTDAVANLVDGAPGALDTLNELAAALGDDSAFASTVTTALAAKASQTSVDDIESKITTSGAGSFGILRGDTGKSYRVVGFVIRNTGSGFAFINDAGHMPVGVSGITQTSDSVVINLDFTATKVVGAVAGPDEALAKLGYTVGASVALSSITLQFGQPGGCADYVYYNGSAFVSLNGFVTNTSMSGATGLVTFTHQALDPIGGAVAGRSAANRVSTEGMTVTTTTCLVYPYNSTTSVKTLSTDLRFWVNRAGSRTVPPTELVQPFSNIWVLGIFEV